MHMGIHIYICIYTYMKYMMAALRVDGVHAHVRLLSD